MTETARRAIPTAAPLTEAEPAAWRALSREEQLARYRDALTASDAGRVGKATMADVLTMARQRIADRRG